MTCIFWNKNKNPQKPKKSKYKCCSFD